MCQLKRNATDYNETDKVMIETDVVSMCGDEHICFLWIMGSRSDEFVEARKNPTSII